MSNFSLNKVESRHQADVRRHAATQHTNSLSTYNRTPTELPSDALSFNDPTANDLFREAMGLSLNAVANRGGNPLLTALTILTVLGVAGGLTYLQQNKNRSVDLGNLISSEANTTTYSNPPDRLKPMPMPTFKDWLPQITDLPANSPTRLALEGIPAERRGQVIELVFPDNRTMPVRLPGMDGKAAEGFLNEIVDYITWQQSFDNSRPYVTGSNPIPLGKAGTVQLEEIDKTKLTKAIQTHPDYENNGVRIPSNKMPGAVKFITAEGAVQAVDAGTKLATDVVTILAQNGSDVNGMQVGIMGSIARGEGDLISESDFDVKLTIHNVNQFINVTQDIEAFTHDGLFNGPLKEAYLNAGVQPSKGLYGHIIIFLVDEATGAVQDTWNELVILP